MTKGNRGKYKNLIKDYMFYLTIVVQDVQLEFEEKVGALEDKHEAAKDSSPDDPFSEDEEEGEDESSGPDAEQIQEELVKLYKEKRKEILQETFKRTFGKWSDKDWDRFTRAWINYAD